MRASAPLKRAESSFDSAVYVLLVHLMKNNMNNFEISLAPTMP